MTNSNNFKNLRGELKRDYSLARFTSWRVGGDAEYFYRPADLSDLQNFLKQWPSTEPIHWIGLGSNILIRDGGVKGVVILTLSRLKEISKIDERTVKAQAGVTCAKLAKFCANVGFENGAFFAGIPGTVGGALAMNAGAFGGETWRHVIEVETLDRKGQLHRRKPEEFSVGYREVKGLNEQYFVSGYFQFQLGSLEKSQQAIKNLLRQRNDSQPIGILSCGSVFRNPPGDFAARLIDTAGLKGMRVGDAYVSDKHANFIINDGKATSSDIEQLIQKVADRVEKIHGVRLIPEVRFLGST